MILAFWIALAAVVVYVASMVFAGLFLDTGGEALIHVARLARIVAIAAGLVFVILFGLHALGVSIEIGKE
jgi:hypothetical protein